MSRRDKHGLSSTDQSFADSGCTERLTMQQRIDAFFAQSGGPHNPQIKTVLEDHLLYGKDHGVKGRKETVIDALMQTIAGDPFLLFMFQQWNNRRMATGAPQSSGGAVAESDTKRLQDQLAALQREVSDLRNVVQTLVESSPSVVYPAVERRGV